MLDRIERVRKARTSSELLEADLPHDEYERFKALKSAVNSAVKELPKSVVDALWHDLSGRPLPMPDYFSDYVGGDSFNEQVKGGRLVLDEENGEVSPDQDYRDVRDASQNISALADFLDDPRRSEEFATCFDDNFGVPMNLKKKGCWGALI